jgi:hypothetical protein
MHTSQQMNYRLETRTGTQHCGRYYKTRPRTSTSTKQYIVCSFLIKRQIRKGKWMKAGQFKVYGRHFKVVGQWLIAAACGKQCAVNHRHHKHWAQCVWLPTALQALLIHWLLTWCIAVNELRNAPQQISPVHQITASLLGYFTVLFQLLDETWWDDRMYGSQEKRKARSAFACEISSGLTYDSRL